MDEKRVHQRIRCAEKCFMYHGGTSYSGAITNISISGALVTLDDGSPFDSIMPGDTCSLILSNVPATSFYRCRSRIIHINRCEVGLEIIEQEL